MGSNYADHAREMGGDPDREPPFFFAKPADAAVIARREEAPTRIPYPPATRDFHHEVELVLAIGKEGVNLPPTVQALDHVFGYGVGVDLTRRDLQALAKASRRPWTSAKGFDHSAPMGALTKKQSFVGGLSESRIWLDVDGEPKQTGHIHQMIWSIPEIVSILSQQFRLLPGDLILTGTPSGVGPIEKGQVVTAGIDGLDPIQFTVD